MTAPLTNPSYVPAHPPIAGSVPSVVTRWGWRSQLRWFDRYRDQLAPGQSWGRFYCVSEHHLGPCCPSCSEDIAAGWDDPPAGGCCCRAIR